MTLGTFAGVPLQDPADTWRHGAVFLLRRGPIRDAAVSLGGWTTRVVKGTKAVVTCGPSTATDFDETHSEALRATNDGLDYMSACGRCDVAIRHDSDDCFVWWRDATGDAVIRARVVLFQTFQFSATGVVTDAAGNTVASPPPPTPSQHDAFRFLRMSRTSEYLFDSYRNMFLAFESLLSDIRPKQQLPNGRYETEKQWFTQALQAADSLVPVARLAPPGEPAPIDWVYTKMYCDERSGLMHAKRGEPYHLPQDDKGRADLRRSLGVLTSYIRELLKAHVGLEYSSGSLSAYGWEVMTNGVFHDSELFVSDDSSTVVAEADTQAPATGSTVVKLPFGPPTTVRPMLRSVLGSCTVGDLHGLSVVGRLGAMSKTQPGPLGVSELTGPLTIGDSVGQFEVEFGVGNINANEPPHFSA